MSTTCATSAESPAVARASKKPQREQPKLSELLGRHFCTEIERLCCSDHEADIPSQLPLRGFDSREYTGAEALEPNPQPEDKTGVIRSTY